MEAKIKATGEIVHVGDYNTISHDPMYKNEKTGPWRLEELDFAIDPDYWTRLEHQYAGMAMQGILGENTIIKYSIDEVCDMSVSMAAALVEKMKEKKE
jgi:hypothetical protein